MGLVLVFDLDQTLIDSSDLITTYKTEQIFLGKIKRALNIRLINEVLIPAAKLRESGQVDAILMLTNNNDNNYVSIVSFVISQVTGYISKFSSSNNDDDIANFFDYIMTRNHPSRQPSGNPPKKLSNVRYMLNELRIPIDNLNERVYFFDDIEGHQIRGEINEGNYIHILPNKGSSGFTKGSPNITNYTHMLEGFYPVPSSEFSIINQSTSSPLSLLKKPVVRHALTVRRTGGKRFKKRTRKGKYVM